MPAAFMLDIVTPERTMLSEPVVSLVVPAANGYLGVLANHAPLVAELSVGALEVRWPDGRDELIAISGGLLEVGGNRATVLADTAERASEIDEARAEEAVRRARERLGLAANVPTVEDHLSQSDEARAALARAENRLRILRRR